MELLVMRIMGLGSRRRLLEHKVLKLFGGIGIVELVHGIHEFFCTDGIEGARFHQALQEGLKSALFFKLIMKVCHDLGAKGIRAAISEAIVSSQCGNVRRARTVANAVEDNKRAAIIIVFMGSPGVGCHTMASKKQGAIEIFSSRLTS